MCVHPLHANPSTPTPKQQSVQVDRDVALSDARLAQEELRRTQQEEIPALQRRVQDLDRALAERQRELSEAERRAAQSEVGLVGGSGWVVTGVKDTTINGPFPPQKN